MLLRMRFETLVVRSAKRVSNHEAMVCDDGEYSS
jgi:hypothetical protein